MPSYVIRSWRASETAPDGSDRCVEISGRAGGLLSWLLGLVEISPVISIAVNRQKIFFEEGSLAGSKVVQVPLAHTCSTFYGYSKPWKEALVVGVAVGLGTFWLAFIPGVIAGVLYYYLNKTLTIGFTDVGGLAYALTFQRSVIEGQNIDERAAERVCGIIQRLVDESRGRVT